jgi:hypothetical protein
MAFPACRSSYRLGLAAAIAGNLVLSALALSAGTQPAKAQDNDNPINGTICEAPTDEDIKQACVVATLDCAFVTIYGHTREEQDRLYKGCIRKIVARYAPAARATRKAIKREFSDNAADTPAAPQKPHKPTAGEIAFAKKQQEIQQDLDAVKQACLSGQGYLSAKGTLQLQGSQPVFIYSGQTVQPIADPDAVASGRCSVSFTQNGHDFTGTLSLVQLDPPTIH